MPASDGASAPSDHVELTAAQVEVIDEFMKKHPEATHAEAQRFCLGRKFVREKIEACYVTYRKLVHEKHYEHIALADVLPELRTQKLYIPGSRDKNGAALFVINAGKHVPGEFPLEDTLRLAFYMSEVLTRSERTQKIGITIISNMDGMDWSTFDADFQQKIINMFVGAVPVRVKHILLVNSPWWVNMMVRIVAPFLKQKMRERIQICAPGQLLDFIDADALPVELGGTLPYSHGAFIRQEMALSAGGSFLPEPVAFRSSRNAPEPSPSMASAQERRDDLLVSPEQAKELNRARAAKLKELDALIDSRLARLAGAQPALRGIDTLGALRSREYRLAMDTEDVLRPNMARPKKTVRHPGPLAERRGENYEPDKLRNRIEASMRKDARHARDGGAKGDSPASLMSPVAPSEVQVVPQIPTSSPHI